MSLYFIINVNRRVRRLGAPFVNHWYMRNCRGAQCAPENRLILRCVGAQCAPLRGNVYQSLDAVRRGRTPGHLLLRRCRNSPCRTLRDSVYHQIKFVGAICHNRQTSCAALSCRACVDEPACVAAGNLTLRRGRGMGAHCALLR